MLRRVVRDSAIYGVAQVLVRGLSIVLLPLFTRVLSPTEYGVLDILTVFASLASVAVALEITQGMARSLADASDEGDKAGYTSTAFWFAASAYGAFGALALLTAPWVSNLLLGSPAYALVVRVATIAICANGMFSVAQNQLRWQLQPARYSLSSVVYTSVSLTLALVLVVALHWGVSGILAGQIGGAAVGTGLAIWFARGRYRRLLDREKLREMLRFSLPLVPSGIGVFATLYVDRIAIKHLMTLADVGVFGVAYRLAGVVTLLLLGVQAALTPLVFTRYRDPDTPSQLARIFRYFCVLALMLCLGLTLFAPEILAFFAAPEYGAGAAVVPLLAPAMLLLGMYIFAPGLDLARRTGVVAAINLLVGALNAALNFALIPRFGIRGAATATLVSAAVLFGVYMAFSQRHYFVPHRWGRLALATLVAAAAGLVGRHFEVRGWVSVGLRIGLLGATGMAFFVLGVVELKELSRGWKRRPSRPAEVGV